MSTTSRKTDTWTSPTPATPIQPAQLGVAGEALVADLTRPYIVAPGSVLRTTPCLICRAPLGSGPVLFHVLITLDECECGDGHILAAAVARHETCVPYNDRTLTHAIERVLKHPVTSLPGRRPVPRLSAPQMAALADWWELAQAAAFGGFTSTDTLVAAADLAAAHGRSLTFTEGSAIATLYGYARRMANAAAAVQGANSHDVITPDHMAVPPWARDEQVMLTAPLWHVTFEFSYLDQAGNLVTDFRTSVFEMTFPGTIGDLTAAVTEDAQALADKYGVTFAGATVHMIMAV